MTNVLSEEKKQQVIALGKLGWPLRRIEQATGVRRETAGAYLKAAGIAVRPPGAWGRRAPAKPANVVTTDPNPSKPANEQQVTTDSGASFSGNQGPPTDHPQPSASACEPYRQLIELGLSRGRKAMALWQDLVSYHGFPGGYQTMKRFVRKLRGSEPEAAGIILTPAGEEGQVDYGSGPMVRQPKTGKYRRTLLFVMTLGHSRKSVRLLVWRSSSRVWARAGPPSLPPRLPQALRIGAERPRFIGPCARREVLAGYRSIGVGKHPARLLIGATANPARARFRVEEILR